MQRMFTNVGCLVDVDGVIANGEVVTIHLPFGQVDVTVFAVTRDATVVTLPNGDGATLYAHPELIPVEAMP